MRVLVAGLPGSGKTTQAKKVALEFNFCFITTGEVLRGLAGEDNQLGRKIKLAIESGYLVDDEIVSEVIKRRLEQPDCWRGAVLDGYPRAVQQLQVFDPGFDKVFYLHVSVEECKKRLFSRGRMDDRTDVIENRFKAQQEKLKELIEYFRNLGILTQLDGEKGVEEIYQQIREELS